MNFLFFISKKLWTIFSSTKTAIFVIIIMGVMLGYGTIVESKHNSNAYAQAVVYHTWWYKTWIGIFLVNLICGTLKKWPWRLSQIPWLCTHMSLLLIFTGALLTHAFGENGTVEIVEGLSADEYVLGDHLIRVEFLRDIDAKTNSPRRYEFFTNFHIFHTDLTPDKTFEIPEKRFKLTVDKFFPFPEEVEHYVEDLEMQEVNPAIHLKLHTPTSSKDLWMLANKQSQKNIFGWGPFALYFECQPFTLLDPETKKEMSLIDEVRLRMEEMLTDATLGTLNVTWKEGSTTKRESFELKASVLKTPQKIGPYSFTWLDYWPELGLETGMQPYMKGIDPVRPAMKVQVFGPKGFEFYRIIEADALQEGSTIRGEHIFTSDYPDVSFQYIPPKNPDDLGKDEVIFVKDSDYLTIDHALEQIYAVARTRFNTFQIQKLSLFKKIDLGEDYSFEMLDIKVKAREARKIKSAGYSLAVRPMISFKVEGVQSPSHKPFLLNLGHNNTSNRGSSYTFQHEGESVRVSYLQYTKPLGFRMRLNKFIKEDYEGTDRAKSYESQVTVMDPKKEKMEDYRIYMNNTLDYKGFRFFQSAYQKLDDGKWKTILEINKDPGYIFLAIGWTFMALSMLALYYVKPYLLRIERERKKRATTPPTES